MGGFKRNVALYIIQFELCVWSQTYCHSNTYNNNLETYSVTNYGSSWWKDVVNQYLEIVSTSFKMSQTCIQTAKQLSLYARTAEDLVSDISPHNFLTPANADCHRVRLTRSEDCDTTYL